MPAADDVRATAIGVVWRDDELLVARLGPFEWDDEVFYRPVGGGVKFGESTAHALVREFREELGATVSIEGFAGVVENYFSYADRENHELVFVYELSFADDARYDQGSMAGVEAEVDITYETEWATLDELEARDEALYPVGLRTILETDQTRIAPRMDGDS